MLLIIYDVVDIDLIGKVLGSIPITYPKRGGIKVIVPILGAGLGILGGTSMNQGVAKGHVGQEYLVEPQ